MYRSIERRLNSSVVTTNQTNHSNTHESTSVIVFKCSNKESRLLVETIRGSGGKSLKTPRRFGDKNVFYSQIASSFFSVYDQIHEVLSIVREECLSMIHNHSHMIIHQ